ncbi:MAG: hypothetical protein M0Q42_00425 [Xanthomonadales bacterium]|nr:hypothetical protein [Xanthomonadales bacterium]
MPRLISALVMPLFLALASQPAAATQVPGDVFGGAAAAAATAATAAATSSRPGPELRRLPIPPQACPDCPATADTVFVNDFQNSALARGGSNLLWFDVDPVDPADPDPVTACIQARDPYGILANYHRPGVRVQVLELLSAMRAAGQRRLSTGLLHLRAPGPAPEGSWGGTLVDSTGGRLHPQVEANLEQFLADINATGFDEILFRYFPQGENTAIEWDSFSEDLYQENWQLIERTQGLLEASGLVFRTDLLVEGMPRAWFTTLPGGNYFIDDDRPANRAWSDYAQRLWRDYVARFGAERSVGFSFVTDSNSVRTRARVRHINYVYRMADGSRVLPPVFAFDIYGGDSVSDRTIFERHHYAMAEIGRDDESWIVAESWFDDATTAGDLKAALETTGRRLEYFTQWPLDRHVDDCGVNVAAPVAYEAYLRQGF